VNVDDGRQITVVYDDSFEIYIHTGYLMGIEDMEQVLGNIKEELEHGWNVSFEMSLECGPLSGPMLCSARIWYHGWVILPIG